MGAKASGYSTSLLNLIFEGTAITNLAQNGVSPVTQLYASLHVSNPLTGGQTQTQGEASYVGYTRVGITRTSAGWTVTGNSVSPAANITFPEATGGSETESFFGIGLSSTGAGTLLYAGSLSPVIIVSADVQPILTTATQISET